MSTKSERAYWRIYNKTQGLGEAIDVKTERPAKWIDANASRILLIVAFSGLAYWGFKLEEQQNLSEWQRAIRSLGPSLAGIVIAAVTIEALGERRLRQQRKAQLIRQLGSKYRDVTEMAIIELRHEGWLEDGSLSRATLGSANLSGAIFGGANPSGAQLAGANLSGADLTVVNLSGAELTVVNLSGAKLRGANLSGAELWKADLSGADLTGANLNGAILWSANLSRAKLWSANLSGAKLWIIKQLEQTDTLEGAVMPDEVQLGQEQTKDKKRIEGPTFEQWKARYLAEHGGIDTDLRGGEEPNDSN